MGRATSGMVAGLVLLLFGAGCQNKLYDQNRALYDENKELREQNERLKQPPVVQQPVVAQQPQAAPVVADTQPVAQETSAPPRAVEQIGGLETTVNPRTGSTTVHLPSDVFFDPGQATLKSSAKVSLDKVVAALKRKFVTRRIIVEGHTDKTPIRVSRWSSNQELSEARADAVKQYLVSHGIEAGRISTKGFGESKPRSGDLAKNRRVEIVVLTTGM